MVQARPFATRHDLLESAERVWGRTSRSNRLEAFRGHPKIGDVESLRSKFSKDRWAGGEQSGAAEATQEVLKALSVANRKYEDRFGFIFIICATGLSATMMLSALEDRLKRSPQAEFEEASKQQAMITALRLDKLVGGPS